jgi:hypothetical protein
VTFNVSLTVEVGRNLKAVKRIVGEAIIAPVTVAISVHVVLELVIVEVPGVEASVVQRKIIYSFPAVNVAPLIVAIPEVVKEFGPHAATVICPKEIKGRNKSMVNSFFIL